MRKSVFILSLIIPFLFSCQNTAEEASKDHHIQVLTTTSLLRDMVQNIGGNHFEVSSLMGSGVDPHLYKPTRGDLKRLREADVVIFNGIHLEGRMQEIREQLAKERLVITATGNIENDQLVNSSEFEDGQDPHFWFDLSLWIQASRHVAAQLIEAYPKERENIVENLTAYIREMDAVHQEALEAVQAIPEHRRVLVTSHDALSYFARTYGFQVKSLQGSSTSAEFGLKDVKDMVDYIIEHEIPAVFPENIVSPQALEALIRGCEKKGHKVMLAEELYSDALGAADSEAATFAGMFRTNVNTIVRYLQ